MCGLGHGRQGVDREREGDETWKGKEGIRREEIKKEDRGLDREWKRRGE